jgi:pyruvate dehydrogenase E1 component
VLWVATSIVHHANKVRGIPSGVKVGGHQASSASMVGIMTALYLEHLNAAERVSVKTTRRRCCTRSTTSSAGSIPPT